MQLSQFHWSWNQWCHRAAHTVPLTPGWDETALCFSQKQDFFPLYWPLYHKLWQMRMERRYKSTDRQIPVKILLTPTCSPDSGEWNKQQRWRFTSRSLLISQQFSVFLSLHEGNTFRWARKRSLGHRVDISPQRNVASVQQTLLALPGPPSPLHPPPARLVRLHP